MQTFEATTPPLTLRINLIPPSDAEGNPTVEFSRLNFDVTSEGQVQVTRLTPDGESSEYFVEYEITFGGVGRGIVNVTVTENGNTVATGTEEINVVPGSEVNPASVTFSYFRRT